MRKNLTAAAIGLFALATMPVTVMAVPEPVASIGDAGFNTLAEAIQVANQYPGSTVEILQDTSFNSTLLTSADVTINLNGHTITRPSPDVRWYVGSIEEPEQMGHEDPTEDELINVVINGDGYFTQDEEATAEAYTPFITVAYCNFEMNDVRMYDPVNYDDASAFDVREGAYCVLNNCDITGNSAVKIFRSEGFVPSYVEINNCILTATSKADSLYLGNAILASVSNNFDTTLVVNDTIMTSENTAVMSLLSRCDTTLTNCALNGPTGIFLKSGNLSLENCTVIATGEYLEEPASGPTISTATYPDPVWDGSGVLVDTNNKYGDTMTLSFSEDTTIVSANGYGLREFGGFEGASLLDIQAEGARITGVKGDISLLEATEEASEAPAEEAVEEPAEEVVEEAEEEPAA